MVDIVECIGLFLISLASQDVPCFEMFSGVAEVAGGFRNLSIYRNLNHMICAFQIDLRKSG